MPFSMLTVVIEIAFIDSHIHLYIDKVNPYIRSTLERYRRGVLKVCVCVCLRATGLRGMDDLKFREKPL